MATTGTGTPTGLFVTSLPIPPILRPVSTDGGVDRYEVRQAEGRQRIRPDRETVIWGYNGTFPGPTIEARRGRPATVTFRNELTVPVLAAGLVAVLAGLMFKISGVPAHFWVPDVTEGSRPPVAAFLTTVPKVGALVATYRLVAQTMPETKIDWPLLIAVIAALSMTLGNFAAFLQTNARRLLAYSTISQVGYILMAVAVATRSNLALPSTLFYLGAYAVTNLGALAARCPPQCRSLITGGSCGSGHGWPSVW